MESAEAERLRALIKIVYDKIVSFNLPDIRHYNEDYSGIRSFEEDLLSGRI